MSNITQVVRTDKNMTTLKKTIIATNLDQVLSSSGPYTLFAPTDPAFAAMDEKAMEKMLQPGNTASLTDLLNSHVVSGKINFRDFEDGQKIQTINGKELSVKVSNGTVTINDAEIKNHDVKSSNGVIHCLDTLLN